MLHGVKPVVNIETKVSEAVSCFSDRIFHKNYGETGIEGTTFRCKSDRCGPRCRFSHSFGPNMILMRMRGVSWKRTPRSGTSFHEDIRYEMEFYKLIVRSWSKPLIGGRRNAVCLAQGPKVILEFRNLA